MFEALRQHDVNGFAPGGNAQAAERDAQMQLLHDVATEANEARTLIQALRGALRRICEYHAWPLAHVYRRDDEQASRMCSAGIWHVAPELAGAGQLLTSFQQSSAHREFSTGEGVIGRVMDTGEPVWVDDAAWRKDGRRGTLDDLGLQSILACPIPADGEVAAVLEFFAAAPIHCDERLRWFMTDVGIHLGHVIEREQLDSSIADATSRQQRHFARELHDSVLQELTGIGMIAETLRQDLKESDSPQLETASLIVEHLQQVYQQVRRISRGLMPVEVDAHGLMSALAELIDSSERMSGILCVFHCSQLVAVEDNDTATHVYRIVQEGIQNAIRHAQPSRIDVMLARKSQAPIITIKDDGSGFQYEPDSPQNNGLRIMRHRADLIGARLTIHTASDLGTRIVCRLRENV